MTRAILIVVVISFVCCVTNFVPISAAASGLSICLVPLLLFRTPLIPRYLFWLALFFLFSFISILTYDPGALTEYGFYRYDGNFIVSYAPLFLVPLLRFNVDVDLIIRRFLLITTAVNGAAFLITVAAYGGHLSAAQSFGGLFIARNAAGGFFSFVITLAFINWRKERTTISALLILINLIYLLATFSRGSLLGIVFSLFCFAFFNGRTRGYFAFFVILIALAWETKSSLDHFNVYRKLNYENRREQYLLGGAGLDGKTANVMLRLYYNWPSGIDLFMHSPIVGGGFGSVNDKPFQFKARIDFVNYNEQKAKIYNDGHAHNSYFHIAGEEGAVGLLLFIGFICALYVYINKLDDEMYFLPKYSLLLYLLNIACMSLTEHRFTTPSNALPFVLLVVILMAKINYYREASALPAPAYTPPQPDKLLFN